jgi:peroxiredoxin
VLEINTPAPDFTLKNTLREDITLSSFRNQNVVLAFYPAAFTGVCEKELCTFRDALAGFNDMNATVLGISVDSPFANGVFGAVNDINFDLLSDYSRSAVNAYGIALDDFAGMPGYTASKRAVFVVDGDGIIRYAWVGPNPGVEPNYGDIEGVLQRL